MTTVPEKHYFVVTKGRKTGTFSTWEECAPHVRFFPSAKVRCFDTLAPAQAHLHREVVVVPVVHDHWALREKQVADRIEENSAELSFAYSDEVDGSIREHCCPSLIPIPKLNLSCSDDDGDENRTIPTDTRMPQLLQGCWTTEVMLVPADMQYRLVTTMDPECHMTILVHHPERKRHGRALRLPRRLALLHRN
jgi:Caulimovirus viroplasmin